MKKNNLFSELSVEEVFEKNSLFWDYLSKNAYPLTKGEIRLPISIEPFEITQSKFDILSEKLYLVISAGKKIVDNYFEDENISKALELCEKEKELFKLSKHEDFLGVVRGDLFYSENPKVVELNTDFPDGFFMHDVTTEALLFNLDRDKHSRLSHTNQFAKLILEVGNYESHIFVGYDRDRFFKDEFELSKLELQKLGFKNVYVGAIEDLAINSENYFSYNGTRIDILRRGTEISKFKDNEIFMKMLKVVLENGTTKIINNFKMRLLGHKNLLSLLTNEKFHHYFNELEINAIEELIPKTLSLMDVDVNDFLGCENKNDWVLKASDLAEGENVYLGCDVSMELWTSYVQKAKTEPIHWILQEKVEIPETEFSIYNDKTKEVDKDVRKFDFNPHIMLYRDSIEFGNILVRFSSENVLNVMKGGGITYCLIKKDN